MSEALDLITSGINLIAGLFGTTDFTLQQPAAGGIAGPMIGAYVGQWNDLGRHEEVTINGRRVSFSVIVECARSQFAQIPKEGQIVIRASDGFTGRIVGEVQVDELTVRFPVDTRNK